ncbi:MAG: ATPase BadF/BadG/BcrA/BcrD type [Cohnella sp.]|nr:ATPase BadF/BadG/BcrA/BcrD type [Cohnella sp.]
MIATGFQPDNRELIERVLVHLQKPTLEALREEIISFGDNWSPEFSRMVRSICPLLTESAQKGIPLAQSVCNSIAKGMAQGIQMLGSCFTSDTVTVTLMGSVLRAPYIKRQTELALANRSCRVFQVVDPALSGRAGAGLMALKLCGVSIDDTLIERLRQHPMAAV